MAATITTKEPFSNSVEEEGLKREIELRLKAGAIRSWYKKEGNKFILYTEWNVFGEQ